MTQKRVGARTVKFAHPPALLGFAAIAGKREGEGPLVNSFDRVAADTTMGEKSW